MYKFYSGNDNIIIIIFFWSTGVGIWLLIDLILS